MKAILLLASCLLLGGCPLDDDPCDTPAARATASATGGKCTSKSVIERALGA